MASEVKFQELDPVKLTQTIAILSERIDERFPGSGLFGVCRKLHDISLRAQEQADWIARPIVPLRIGIGVFIALIFVGLAGSMMALDQPVRELTPVEFIQAFESAINDLVLIGVAIVFLVTLERRFKRHRALQAIHELRAMAHIIDMHQLTKDPGRMQWEARGVVEPRRPMTAFELTRYLDYCSEMLSLVGKICVLYVQRFEDPVSLSAVNEVENLTTGLSRKIWQKLIIIHEGKSFPLTGTPTSS